MKGHHDAEPIGPQIPGGWMDTKTAAAYGGLNVKVLERAAKKKKVKSGQIGGRYRFKAEYIDALLKKGGFDGTIQTNGAKRS